MSERETEATLRAVMPEESTIELDDHARRIAAVVAEARARGREAELDRELARSLDEAFLR